MSNQRRVDGNDIYQPKDFAMSYNLSGKPEKMIREVGMAG